MKLSRIKHINKGKRHKRKHYFNVGDSVVFKWWGDRDYGFITHTTRTKEGYATYTVRATGRMGCIYSDLQLDDPEDTYCYISSVLTNSISDRELLKISEHKNGAYIRYKSPNVKSTADINRTKSVSSMKKVINKSELKKAVEKQKDFLNGNVNKSFW